MKRSGWVTVAATIALGLIILAPAHAADLNGTLDTPVTAKFEKTTLADVLKFFNEKFDINIVVDSRVIAPAGTAVEKPYVTDGKVDFLDVKGVKFREALKALLKPLGLDFSVQQNYIWISTPYKIQTEAFEGLETKVYQLSDRAVADRNATLRQMKQPEIDFDSLVILVSGSFPKIIEPVTERLMSYARYNLQTKQLVVHNTPTNQKKVEQIIQMLFGEDKEQAAAALTDPGAARG